MKSRRIILGITFLLIITLVLTNPKKENHLDLIFNEFIVNKEELVQSNGLELMALPFAKNAFGEILSVDNYVLFSVGKIDYNGIKKNISIGLFGNVFLLINESEWSNLGNNLNEKEEAIDTTKVEKIKKLGKYTTVEDKVYGDFDGDGKTEYAYRELIKKGFGNPVEDGEADIYRVKFSNENIKPIENNFSWIMLINEGDLNNDGADELSVYQEPLNGCVGYVTTYSIKRSTSDVLIDNFSFYSDACDSELSIDLNDLVEKTKDAVYYYEYNPDSKFVLNSVGKKIVSAKKIKAFDIEPKTNQSLPKNSNDALSSILNGGYYGKNSNSEKKEQSEVLGNRKAVTKASPEFNCTETGRVVVQITVDRHGNVIKAIAGVQGTTNTSKCLIEASEKAALNTRWTPDENAPKEQVGKIVYSYTLN